MKDINIKEYVSIAGISQPAIAYRMKQRKTLPGIDRIRFDVETKQYVLTYNGMSKAEIQKYFQKKTKKVLSV